MAGPCRLHSILRPGTTRYRSSLFRVQWIVVWIYHMRMLPDDEVERLPGATILIINIT